MNLTQLERDINFIKSILPAHYEVKESAHKGSAHCKSREGMRYRNNDDNEQWGYVELAINNYFKERLSEIDFNTNAFYQDFTIYLKNNE